MIFDGQASSEPRETPQVKDHWHRFLPSSLGEIVSAIQTDKLIGMHRLRNVFRTSGGTFETESCTVLCHYAKTIFEIKAHCSKFSSSWLDIFTLFLPATSLTTRVLSRCQVSLFYLWWSQKTEPRVPQHFWGFPFLRKIWVFPKIVGFPPNPPF